MKKDRKRTEICQQCGEDYIPTRRGVQKYCSNSCRSRYWTLHNEKESKKPNVEQSVKKGKDKSKPKKKKKTKIEEVSTAGVGNAFIGTTGANLAAAVLKEFITPEENKPATKGDLDNILQMIYQRYLPIVDMKPNVCGQKPFYDRKTQKIAYIGVKEENESLNVI